MSSMARVEANRRNAAKSTGPKTAEGKGRSRWNAIKHGLRSAQIVLPTEDPAAFDEHMAAWMDDWRPPTKARQALVERSASAAWRLSRCVRVEKAMLSSRAVDAAVAWDCDREDKIDEIVDHLQDEPAEALHLLRMSRAGALRLVELWEGLADALARPDGWRDQDDHHIRLINLQGMTPADPEADSVALPSWRLLLANRPDLAEDDSESPFDPETAENVRQFFIRNVANSIAQVRRHADELPGDASARNRHAEIAALSFRPEDLLLHRYEGRLDREFRLNLNALAALTKSGVDLVEDAAPNEANPAPIVPDAPIEPNPGPVEVADEAAAPNEANPVASDLPVAKADRDRDGRTWPVEVAARGAERVQTDPLIR